MASDTAAETATGATEADGSDRTGIWRRVAHGLGLLVLLVLVAAVVVAAVPGIIGMDDSFVVQSDSMSPSIEAGSMVFVSSASAGSLAEGDVITFRRAGTATPITHRIVDVREQDGQPRYETKGDANEEPDPELVRPEQVVGTVAFSVPLLGYLVRFANSPIGLVVLVGVPGLLLAATEAYALLSGGGDGGGDP